MTLSLPKEAVTGVDRFGASARRDDAQASRASPLRMRKRIPRPCSFSAFRPWSCGRFPSRLRLKVIRNERIRTAGLPSRRHAAHVPAAPVSSVNVDERTADVVWSTGAQVKRYDWWNDRTYLEELSLDPASVRLGRLNGGAARCWTPTARGRCATSSGDRGATRRPSTAKEGRCQVRFSKRDDVEPIFRDVADGIIGAVSVGYVVHKVLRIAPRPRPIRGSIGRSTGSPWRSPWSRSPPTQMQASGRKTRRRRKFARSRASSSTRHPPHKLTGATP